MAESQIQLGSVELQVRLSSHAGRLHAYLSRHLPADLRRLIDPQDVAQDAFLEASSAADRFEFRDADSDWRWIVTIARHRLIKLIALNRAKKRGGCATHVYGDEEMRHGSVIVMLQELAVHHRTPSKSAARHELLLILEQCIGGLDHDYREAVRLRYIDGLSLCQTAERLSRTEDSTQKLCSRGLQALRAKLRSVSLYV